MALHAAVATPVRLSLGNAAFTPSLRKSMDSAAGGRPVAHAIQPSKRSTAPEDLEARKRKAQTRLARAAGPRPEQGGSGKAESGRRDTPQPVLVPKLLAPSSCAEPYTGRAMLLCFRPTQLLPPLFPPPRPPGRGEPATDPARLSLRSLNPLALVASGRANDITLQ